MGVNGSNQDAETEKQTISLSFKIKTISSKKSLMSRFFSFYRVSPVQGEPFIWGVEIKNISDIPSPEIEIVDPYIVNLDNTYCENADRTIAVRPLNPSEMIYVELDKCTVFLEGVMWAKFLVRPKYDDYEVLAYQVDENHNKLMPCTYSEEDDTNWLKDLYVHKKSEVLQGRTNNLIVALTVITVLEAVFKIKECLKFLLWCVSEFFELFANFFSFLSELIS
jgi:hypothetical protein